MTEEERTEIGTPPQGRGLFRYLIDEGNPLLVDDIASHRARLLASLRIIPKCAR